VSLGPRRKPAVIFIFITLVLDVIGIGIVIPILPKVVEQFQGGDVSAAAHIYGALAALYALMQFMFAPLIGALSDRYGRRRVILISLLGSGLDYFLFAWAPSLAWLFIGRIISGITGANTGAAMAYIADITPPEKRAAHFGLIGAAFGIGFVLGPALGGLLGDIHLRLPFVVAGVLTLVNWAYGCFVLPESLAPENRRPVRWQRANPIGALVVLRQYPLVLTLVGTYFLCHLAHQCFPATWVLYTSHRYHWTARDVGVSLALIGLLSGTVQAGLTRVFVQKLGERKTATLGMSIAVASLTAYGFATQGWMVYVISVFGAFAGVTGPAVQGLISRNVRADEQGSVQGALASLSSVAGVFGPPIATGLFAHFIRPTVAVQLPGAAFFFSAMLVFCALMLAIRAFRQPAHAEAATLVAR
jgi:DHA1 family tetracycline resistance protein-like MFS transporter